MNAFVDRARAALHDVPFELVVVDDGSTDGTPRVLASSPRPTTARARRAAVAQLRPPDRADGRARPRARRRRRDARRRPAGPARADPRDARRAGARAPTSSTPCARAAGETRFKLATARWFYRVFRRLAGVELRARRGRLPAAWTAARSTRCSDARAQPLPARDERVGRLHADRGRLRARRRATPGDTKYSCAHGASSPSTRSTSFSQVAAAARDAARVRLLAGRLPRPARWRSSRATPGIYERGVPHDRSSCCCSAASS